MHDLKCFGDHVGGGGGAAGGGGWRGERGRLINDLNGIDAV